MIKENNKDGKTAKKGSNITTLAVNISVSDRIEEYCKRRGMLKKDFVPRAIEYIESFDVDLTSETMYFEDKKAEKTRKEIEREDIQTLPTIRERLSRLDEILNLAQANGALEERSSILQGDNAQMKEELAELRQQAIQNAILLEKAKAELRRLGKGMFNRPDKAVMKDLGIQD